MIKYLVSGEHYDILATLHITAKTPEEARAAFDKAFPPKEHHFSRVDVDTFPEEFLELFQEGKAYKGGAE
jgi:hypothetical protein